MKPLNLRFNNTLIERFSPNSEYVLALQDAVNLNFSETKLKLTEMYDKYRAEYDCKVEAKPLALFCLLLNPKLMTQSYFATKSLPIWLPLSYPKNFDNLYLYNPQSWHELHTMCTQNSLKTCDPTRSG